MLVGFLSSVKGRSVVFTITAKVITFYVVDATVPDSTKDFNLKVFKSTGLLADLFAVH